VEPDRPATGSDWVEGAVLGPVSVLVETVDRLGVTAGDGPEVDAWEEIDGWLSFGVKVAEHAA
jgi:hypothetical protein